MDRKQISIEEDARMNRLHAYSSHNANLIAAASRCYCFYCKKSMDRREIETYADNGQTAICPKCGIDAIIPDSVGEPVDDGIIAQMHEYWF